ncbi:hypothetical protein FNJ84_09260 [Paracoccus sp. M683]|uniref:ribosome-inactivating family protein n=1 Tax=Paracoccus sp. M683 TaxID=2594268 RepID=UPI00117EA410|nr:ribosome-inactivating family protein [Paracoccus sp. M683]TRW97670.1 hypothetical protein FNJ84_09260 [Paracoccus sp. M683]
MTKNEYIANITALNRTLATLEAATGDLVPRTAGAANCVEVEVGFSLARRVKLMIQYGDLYIQGFRNKDGELFLFAGSKYNGSGAVASQFNGKTDYGSLGWSRHSGKTVTLDDLDNALTTFYNAKAGTTTFANVQNAMLCCALGFAEALRFQDVSMAVMNGTEIASADVDWSARTKANDYKVRVKHR